jgi:hypothetical protein
MAKSPEPFSVFYAWQSDTPQTHCRTLIRDALDAVADKFNMSDEIPYRLVIDQDTQNVPGLCDIPATLLGKIERADAVVADLTYVAKTTEGKHCSNPNVLFELGFAFRAINPDRLICVMNETHGPRSETIFDIAHRRHPIAFKSPDNPKTRADVVESLAAELEGALKLIIAHGPRSQGNHDANRHESESANIETIARARTNRPAASAATITYRLCPSAYRPRRWASTAELESVMRQRAQVGGRHEFPPQQRGTSRMPWGIYNDLYGEAWALTYAGQFLMRCPVAADFDAPELEEHTLWHFVEAPRDGKLLAGQWISFVPLIRGLFDAFEFGASLSETYHDHEMIQFSIAADGLTEKWLWYHQGHSINLPQGPCISPTFSRSLPTTPQEFRQVWRETAADWATELCGLFARDGFEVKKGSIEQWFAKCDRNEFG